MKKILMVVAAVATLCSSNAFAQKVNLPAKGTFGTEVQFNPFDQDGKQFKLDALKLRYFLTDKDALRLSIGLDMVSDKYTDEVIEDHDDNGKDDYFENTENKYKKGSFSIDLGYERHFLQKGRVDLYAGAEIGIVKGFTSANEETTITDDLNESTETKTTEYSSCMPVKQEDGSYKVGPAGAGFGIRASIFTGIDFYLYKGLYVGTELGLKINSFKTADFEYTETETGSTPDTTESTDNIRETTVKFDITPTIRLGWSF